MIFQRFTSDRSSTTMLLRRGSITSSTAAKSRTTTASACSTLVMILIPCYFGIDCSPSAELYRTLGLEANQPKGWCQEDAYHYCQFYESSGAQARAAALPLPSASPHTMSWWGEVLTAERGCTRVPEIVRLS